jgi:hypothetical protein
MESGYPHGGLRMRVFRIGRQGHQALTRPLHDAEVLPEVPLRQHVSKLCEDRLAHTTDSHLGSHIVVHPKRPQHG